MERNLKSKIGLGWFISVDFMFIKSHKFIKFIEMWDNSTVVEENLPKEVDEVVEGKLSLKKFHTSACRDREQSTFAK